VKCLRRKFSRSFRGFAMSDAGIIYNFNNRELAAPKRLLDSDFTRSALRDDGPPWTMALTSERRTFKGTQRASRRPRVISTCVPCSCARLRWWHKTRAKSQKRNLFRSRQRFWRQNVKLEVWMMRMSIYARIGYLAFCFLLYSRYTN